MWFITGYVIIGLCMLMAFTNRVSWERDFLWVEMFWSALWPLTVIISIFKKLIND